MPERRPGQAGVLSRPRVHALVLLAAAALGLYLCYRLVQPFLPALSWGLALAVVGYPVHKVICRRVPSPSLAAGLTVLVISVVIIAPVVLVTHQLVRQTMDWSAYAQEAVATGSWREIIDRTPPLAALFHWIEPMVSLDDVMPRLGTMVEEWAPSVLAGGVGAAVQLGVTILVLFYVFRDKRELVDDTWDYLPLSEHESQHLVRRVTETIQATIFGSLTVAAVQGLMGGLMFSLLGLPAPVLWGAVMAVLATIPIAGTFLVWGPTAIYLALTGAWVKALVLAGWGAIAIGLIDNVLYPILVGKRLRFHPLPIFFSIVGGLTVFGMAGLVLGPLTLSVTTALLEALRRRTAAGTADSRAAA